MKSKLQANRNVQPTIGMRTVMLILTIISLLVLVGCEMESEYLESIEKKVEEDLAQEARFSVTYDENGSDEGSVPTDANEYSTGAVVTVLAPGSMGKTGYLFDGWCFDQDGESSYLYADNTFVIGTTGKTLYAQWVPANTVLTPQFSPASGTYDIDKDVEITCAPADAIIYYTVDGNDPTTSSAQYSTPVTITGSVSGTTTQVRALAVKTGYNDSSIGSASYMIDYPNAPSGVSASNGISTSYITVTWSGTGEAEYYVYRNTSNSTTGRTLIADNVTTTTFTDSSIESGIYYFYWVRGHNPVSGALSDYSSSDSGYIALSTPGSFTASDGTSLSQVSLSWGEVAGASTYYLYRNTVNLLSSATLVTTTTNLSYNDNASLTPGKLYYYWVRAYDSTTDQFSSAQSNTGFVKLAAPSTISATDGTYTDRIDISWSDVTGATDYYLYRNTTNTIPPSSFVDTTQLSYSDQNTPATGTQYFYWVKAYSDSSESYSSPSGSNSGYKKLAVPGNLAASQGTTTAGVALSWNEASGATAYYLYRNTSNTTTGAINIGNTSGTSYTDTGASVGTGYYYWVRAYDNNPAQYSNYSSDGIYGYKKLASPGGFTAEDGADTSNVGLDWNDVNGAVNYVIYRDITTTQPATPHDSTSVTYYYDTSASPGVQYNYWVEAYDNSPQQWGDPSYNSGFRRISAPDDFNASDGLSGKIELTWRHVAGTGKYYIQRSPSPWTLPKTVLLTLGTSTGDPCIFTTSGTTGQTYTFTIKGYDSSPSHYSPEATDSGYEN